MDQLMQHVMAMLRGMWHRRWFGLGVAWIVAIVAITIAFRIPERYEATARVYVDTQTLLRPLLSGLSIQPNLDQQVAMMSRTLFSRPNVENVVRMADLDFGATSQTARDEQIDGLMKSVQMSGNAQTNLYVIAYRSANPEQARKVVQSFLTIFVESSLGDKRQDTQAAVKFVDDQIKQYEESLKQAENRLKEFRLKYLGMAGQGGPDYYSRLSKLGDDIATAKLELRAAEEARDSYKRELAGESPLLLPDSSQQASVAPAVTPAIDARLEVLRTELDVLKRRYTDSHPDVLGTKRNIEQLEEQRKTELQAMTKAASPGKSSEPIDRNPVFQRLKVSVAEADANVASLRAKVNSYESQYAQLKSAARLVPQIEVEHAQLNRDYDVHKRVYESLLARRQSAAIGEGVQDAGGTKFRVIDPPRVSQQPVPPTRVMLLVMAIAAALGAGLLASFVASELMPTFHDARSLRSVANRPVLGMITMVPSASVNRLKRRKVYLFAGGLTSLVGSFVAVVAFALLMGRAA